MIYKIFKPAPRLRPFVESYTLFEDDGVMKNVELAVVPSGTPEITIHFGDGVESYLNYPGTVRTGYLYGPHTRPGFFKSTGSIKCLCINFKPLGLNKIMGMPQIETRNCTVDLELLFGRQGKNLIERVCLSQSHVKTVELVNHFLTKQVSGRKIKIRNITGPLRYIKKTNGTAKIRDICRDLKINIKTLERIFKKLLGLTPKEYANIIRLNHAYDFSVNYPDMKIQDIISHCGYYDQAHLVNDVRRYTRLTPQKLFLNSTSHVIYVNRLYTCG